AAGIRPYHRRGLLRTTCVPLGVGDRARRRERRRVVGENPTPQPKSSSGAPPQAVPLSFRLLREHRPRLQVVQRHLELVVVEAPRGGRLLALLLLQPPAQSLAAPT